tara:strand:+ start:3474 stop:3662 length:189 start_codon:yes stop_codon:yes gene_type:complete
MEDRLKVLALWLKDWVEMFDSHTEGVLEAALRRSKDETIQEIGSLLEEVLEMDVDQIKNELK